MCSGWQWTTGWIISHKKIKILLHAKAKKKHLKITIIDEVVSLYLIQVLFYLKHFWNPCLTWLFNITFFYTTQYTSLRMYKYTDWISLKYHYLKSSRDVTCTLLSLVYHPCLYTFLYWHPYFNHQFYSIVFMLVKTYRCQFGGCRWNSLTSYLHKPHHNVSNNSE